MVLTIWKSLPDFPFFKVSNAGKVEKLNKGVWSECGYYTNKQGYKIVTIRNVRGEWEHIGIHRLVAMAFIPKPESKEKLVVNHLDENPENNRADNLEWVTQGKNVLYSKRRKLQKKWEKTGLPKYPIPGPAINQYDLNLNLVKTWGSIREVALALTIPYAHIDRACCSKRDDEEHWRNPKPLNGFWWTRAKDSLPLKVLEHRTEWQLTNEG